MHRLAVPAPEALPFAIGTFETIGPLSRASFPHRHTFYEVVLVTGGTGTHVIDFVEQPLRPPHLYVIAPGQVHFWDRVSGLCGRVTLFTDEFLLAHPGDRAVLHALSEVPWLELTAGEAADFAALMAQMEREYRRRDEGFTSVLQAYLHVLVVRARRSPGIAPPARGTDRATGVVQRFSQLLSDPKPGQRSVAAYAGRIGVSVSYLNDVVKEVTGRTPGKLIREVQVLEAKRLLARTGMTVGQVARELNFDPAYFCRFFRRETGVSPGTFRRGVGGNHHIHPQKSIDVSEFET
ncbi:AraC family transcriptional regulator [Micromonospora polyrhachis]|uniref:AraC-like DNA-binding protein n=1 Tax=Micromonospora polyrhachis TaxID=1282883 RepID=A0A7W7WSW4_9ACTN|nr:helix-turn-helix domain-containing protein [Micromonospora polyrhachis]MBB4962626.1 AraC-like DNA-binding protein [Micromonospora polyrhachis]